IRGPAGFDVDLDHDLRDSKRSVAHEHARHAERAAAVIMARADEPSAAVRFRENRPATSVRSVVTLRDLPQAGEESDGGELDDRGMGLMQQSWGLASRAPPSTVGKGCPTALGLQRYERSTRVKRPAR